MSSKGGFCSTSKLRIGSLFEMGRDNESWMAELRGAGPQRDAALTDLRDALVRNLRRALSNRPHLDDAFLEDAVQDSLLRILDRLDQFQGRSRFLTWATAITIRLALDELRRRRWKDVSLDALTDQAGFVPHHAIDAPSAAARLERQALLDTMHQLIETSLTPKQKSALLAELKGMPQDDIARHLGSNRNAVYKLTHDARKKLRWGLEAAGYTAEEAIAAGN
jgi:RNA polymerase sigma factor (sigma-70 family)